LILAIVVMTMVIAMVNVVNVVARVWDDRGGEERGN
jgi:Flp pilus assembly pilin Flp